MMWRNTRDNYGLINIGLHWMMVVAIAVLLPLGLWMTGLDYYDPWYRKGPDLHRAIGVLTGAVLLLRLAWRIGNRAPDPLSASDWESKAALLVHRLLYLLPLLLVISGYLISTADGRGVSVFGWFEIPATLQGLEGQEDIAGEVHFILAMILLAVVTLHAGAALRHHFILKDDTLLRMLNPGNKEIRDEPTPR